MHISEGVLSGPVLGAGAVLTACGTAMGLKNMDYDKIAQTGMLSAAFFVASLIHVPIGPSSVHLVLNGLVGLLMGWTAFPIILVALALQAVFFQFGGITTLGVNTFNMAAPAVLCHYLFKPFLFKKTGVCSAAAFGAGFSAIFIAAVLTALSLVFTEENFFHVAALIVAANFPVMIVEGIITAFSTTFIQKVHPSALPGYVHITQSDDKE